MGRCPARQGRPDSGEELRRRWVEELGELGFTAPWRDSQLDLRCARGRSTATRWSSWRSSRLGSRRSAWNAADARGEVEQLIASSGRASSMAPYDESWPRTWPPGSWPRRVRCSAATTFPSTSGRSRRPTCWRSSTTIVDRIVRRAEREEDHRRRGRRRRPARRAGSPRPASRSRRRGGRMVVVTPTRKAAQVAAGEVGSGVVLRRLAAAPARLPLGRRRPVESGRAVARLAPALRPPYDLLVVDEAGMLDQDTARALLAARRRRPAPGWR